MRTRSSLDNLDPTVSMNQPDPTLERTEAAHELDGQARAPLTDLGLTLVVPLFNEARRLPVSFERIAAFIGSQPEGSELLLVDDGSADGTADAVAELLGDRPGLSARLLRRPHLGKGATVRAGLEQASTALAGFCDVDLATPLEDFSGLVAVAGAEGGLVIGSRDLRSSRIVRHESSVRETLGRAYNRAIRGLVVGGVADTQCGAKVAPTAIWRQILAHCREDGFAWDVEALAVARALGIPVSEIGVTWAHDDDSRVRVLQDGAAMLSSLPRIRRRARAARIRPGASATGGGVFDDRNAADLAASDTQHWWFRSKAEFVSSAFEGAPAGGYLVDIGAGSGGVTAMLRWPRELKVAVDGNEQLVRDARERHALEAVAADVADVPLPDGSASIVCLLDVIEHLTDPGPALREAGRLLRPGGSLVVTVPAHPSLWSVTDEALGHARRYSRATLLKELEATGFESTSLTHVFSWLFLPVWLKRRRDTQPQLGLDVSSPAIERIAVVLTRLERGLVRRVSLPVGTSLLCSAVSRA